jgi:serine/threonine protein kinase
MASLSSHPALATESAERLIESLFPQTSRPEQGGHKSLSESDLRRVSDVLQRMGKDSWSRVPRIYAVLRTINQLQVLDSFIAQGVSDIWFPFSHKTLPDALRNPSARFEFLEAQGLVLTKALDLERDDDKHRHFSRAEDVPLSKLEELGKGGFGYVDRVLSTITYKEYARKLIPRGRTFKMDMEVLRDFERELGHLKKLSHLHIVELVGSYTDPKFVGIIMSPVADYNLKEFLALDPLPAGGRSFLRTFFGCLASALCYLHDNRVRHKDVKPQNVLVKGHQVYLTDFGISLDWSELGQSTTSGPTIKTPRYCAPEVADYAPRNSLSDVWSLGCVFLEIWTVLKGETIVALLEHLENHNSRSTCYYLNCDAVKTWCETLLQKPGTTSDNPPSACIYEMMQSDQDRRWTARMTLDHIQEVNADPDNRFAFSGLCCVDDGDSDESLHSSKRNSANLDETGASSLGVPPIHTTLNVDESAEAGGSAVDLTLSQTLKPSKADKSVLDPPESTIDANARQENRNMTTPSFAPTDSKLESGGPTQDEISKKAQLPSERSISTSPDPILTSDFFAHSSGADQLSEDLESLERSGGIAASSSDNLVLRPSPLDTVDSGTVDQMEQSEFRDEPAQAFPMDKTSPYKPIPAIDTQRTTTAQDSSDEDWHDPENSQSSTHYESPTKGPELSRKFSFSGGMMLSKPNSV